MAEELPSVYLNMVNGNLLNSVSILEMQFHYLQNAYSLSVWFFRVEGNVWGNPDLRECLTLGIITTSLQRTYRPWADTDSSGDYMAGRLHSDLFGSDNLLNHNMNNRVRIRWHSQPSLQVADRNLHLRRIRYQALVYHVTLMFQSHTDLQEIIAVEFLVRREGDDSEDDFSPGFYNEH